MITQRLEGSRFIRRQLYRLAASGSRERLLARQLYRLYLGQVAIGVTHMGVHSITPHPKIQGRGRRRSRE